MELNKEYILNRIRELREYKAKLEKEFYAAEACIGELVKLLDELDKEENNTEKE